MIGSTLDFFFLMVTLMPINRSEGKNGTQWDASWCVNSN